MFIICGKMRTKLPERRGRGDGEVKRRAKNKGKPLKSRPQFYQASYGMKIQSKEEEDAEGVSNKSLGRTAPGGLEHGKANASGGKGIG